MHRRSLLKSLPLGLGAAAVAAQDTTRTPLPKMKITRVRFYHTKTSRPVFNQSSHIVTVETDQGITGIGEGGTRDPIVQLAGLIIGEDPSRIEHLWQLMYRHYFYPPGREKIHAQGAIDLALWDIKGKALGVPVYELLGGLARNHVECYVADSRAGKLYTNERPGLGVEFDPGAAELVAEITEQYRPTPLYNRPDGSITNW